MIAQHWNTDVTDLRNRALPVLQGGQEPSGMNARTAARCMSGVMGLVARQFSVVTMQRTCADLVRYEMAWETQFGWLPLVNGKPTKATELIAVIARGIMPICGVANMRAALSFWATESDPQVWSDIAQG